MNTPRTLAAISQFSSQIQGTLLDLKDVDEFNELLDTIDKLLGLGLSDIKDISDSQKRLIQDRNEARSNQDWTLSDKLRDEIAKQGIGLRDTDYGTIWYPL